MSAQEIGTRSLRLRIDTLLQAARDAREAYSEQSDHGRVCRYLADCYEKAAEVLEGGLSGMESGEWRKP